MPGVTGFKHRYSRGSRAATVPVRQWREDSEIFGNLDTTVIGLGFFWSFGFFG